MSNVKQDISYRLKEVRQHLKMSVNDFAKALGVEPQTVRDYENGKSIPGGDKVGNLIKLGVDSNWLLAGPGYDSVPFNEYLTVAKKYQQTSRREGVTQDQAVYDGEHLYIEQYSDVRAAAGNGKVTPTDQVIINVAVNAIDWRKKVGLNPQRVKIITVYGDSMTPTLSHGDQVFIDTACESFIDDAIYVIQQGDLLRIKRVKLLLNGSIEVKSDNSHGFPIDKYSAEEAQSFKVIGKVLPFKFGQFNL